MNIKDWLNRGWNLNMRIEALEKSGDKVFHLDTCGDTSYGEGSELSKVIIRERKRLDGILAEITALISRVEDNTLATLLQDRYVRCMTWDQIANDLGYCRYHVTKTLHPAALAAAEKCFFLLT